MCGKRAIKQMKTIKEFWEFEEDTRKQKGGGNEQKMKTFSEFVNSGNLGSVGEDHHRHQQENERDHDARMRAYLPTYMHEYMHTYRSMHTLQTYEHTYTHTRTSIHPSISQYIHTHR